MIEKWRSANERNLEKMKSKEVIHVYEHDHASEDHPHAKWHLLLMLLCCLIPIVIIVAISFTNIGGPYLPFLLLVLLCPLMMLLMLLPRILFKRT